MDKFEGKQKELVECLARIGYSVSPIGCGHFQVVNDIGKPTKFVLDSEKLELKDDKVFGNNRRINEFGEGGWVVFTLRDCVIEFDGTTKEAVHVSNKERDIFVTFKKIKDKHDTNEISPAKAGSKV
jgi:hypothetical protein